MTMFFQQITVGVRVCVWIIRTGFAPSNRYTILTGSCHHHTVTHFTVDAQKRLNPVLVALPLLYAGWAKQLENDLLFTNANGTCIILQCAIIPEHRVQNQTILNFANRTTTPDRLNRKLIAHCDQTHYTVSHITKWQMTLATFHLDRHRWS